MPFGIPDNWTWIRLKNISDLNGGYAFKSEKFCNNGIRVIRISDFDEKGFKNKDIKRYPYSPDLDSYRIIPRDILLCMTGGTVGKSAYIKVIDEDCYINQRVALIRIKNINVDFFYSVLTSSYILNVINTSKTSTNDNISMKLIEDFLIPLPPIHEELRIVDKINSFSHLISQYSIAEEKLSTLESEFPEKLKKSILQYAIEGKLVKQDPNDEPASVLLERIKIEKEKLIKEGKIKRDKNETYIYQGDDKKYYEKSANNQHKLIDNLPFDIPNNWNWVRFSNLVYFVLGKTPERHNQKYWINSEYPWFSILDMKNKEVVYTTKEKISKVALKENFNSILSPIGTLLMSFKLTVGRVSILGINAVHNEAIISIYPYLKDCNYIRDWLFHFLEIITTFVDKTDAIKGSTLNKEKLSLMLVPLPPLSEQNKIMSKINKLQKILYMKNYEKNDSNAK